MTDYDDPYEDDLREMSIEDERAWLEDHDERLRDEYESAMADEAHAYRKEVGIGERCPIHRELEPCESCDPRLEEYY